MEEIKVWDRLQDKTSKIVYMLAVLCAAAGMITYAVILGIRVQEADESPASRFSFDKETTLEFPGLFICPFGPTAQLRIWAESQTDENEIRHACTWSDAKGKERYCPTQVNASVEIFPGEKIEGCFIFNGDTKTMTSKPPPAGGEITELSHFKATSLKDSMFLSFTVKETPPTPPADDYVELTRLVFLGMFNRTEGPSKASISVVPYKAAVFATVSTVRERLINGTSLYTYAAAPISSTFDVIYGSSVSASEQASYPNPTQMIFRPESLFVTTSSQYAAYTAGDAFSALGGAWSYVGIVFGALFTLAVPIKEKPKKKLRFVKNANKVNPQPEEKATTEP